MAILKTHEQQTILVLTLEYRRDLLCTSNKLYYLDAFSAARAAVTEAVTSL